MERLSNNAINSLVGSTINTTVPLINALDNRAMRRYKEGKHSFGVGFGMIGMMIGSYVNVAGAVLLGLILGGAGAILAGVLNYRNLKKIRDV